jgi:tetratricopeptide (TPR) repeat protein
MQAERWPRRNLLSIKATDDEEGLQSARTLGATWDTVGWVYFRLGDYEKALSYARAAWLLGQQGLDGDHLGQIYEKLGRKQEAAHAYRLAYAAVGQHTSPATAVSREGTRKSIRQHYKLLMGKDAEPTVLSTTRRTDGTFTPTPIEELSRIRTVKIATAKHESGSAIFTVLFSPDKANDVRYFSGMESFKALSSQLGAAKFKVELPDSGPVRLYRRAMLLCAEVSGCDAVLLPPDSTHVFDSSGVGF